MKQIPLNGKHGKGKFALVDDEDYEELMQCKWLVTEEGYVRGKIAGKNIYMHRLILKPDKIKQVDHVNHNKLDNQKINIRICTQSENNMNRKPYKSKYSIYKGICFKKSSNRWFANIRINSRLKHIGYFDTELEAAKAYNAKALELFGEFAHLNKIEP
jgi:hypothetical protein